MSESTGPVQVSVAAVGGAVRLAFDRSIADLSLTPQEAQQFVQSVASKIDEARIQGLQLELEAARREIAQLKGAVPHGP